MNFIINILRKVQKIKVGVYNMKELNFIGIGGATNIKLGGNCCYLKDGNNLLVIDMPFLWDLV